MRDFDTMSNYPPCFLHHEIWGELCNICNMEEWLKKSEIGKSNRKKADNDDVISRHTGGLWSYDEYHIILQLKLGRPPAFKELFLATHLTKESKKFFWAGLYDESLEGADFYTTKSKEAYEEYAKYMVEKYGEDVTQHPVGDVELWERAQGGGGLGIGSLDIGFVVTDTPSSSSGSAFYTADYHRSQEQVGSLQSQVEVLHNRLKEVQQNMREEMHQQMREEIQQMREDIQL